jgi:hypothetical protein
LEAARKLGVGKWAMVAQAVGNRTDNQVRRIVAYLHCCVNCTYWLLWRASVGGGGKQSTATNFKSIAKPS